MNLFSKLTGFNLHFIHIIHFFDGNFIDITTRLSHLITNFINRGLNYLFKYFDLDFNDQFYIPLAGNQND